MTDLTERKGKLHDAILAEFETCKQGIAKLCGTPVLLYANGTWTLRAEDQSPIARFNLVPFLNCGAIAILCDLFIEPAYRMVGLGRVLQDLRIHAAARCDVQVLLATVVTENKYAMSLVRRWQEVVRFTNPETGHEVVLVMLKLK